MVVPPSVGRLVEGYCADSQQQLVPAWALKAQLISIRIVLYLLFLCYSMIGLVP